MTEAYDGEQGRTRATGKAKAVTGKERVKSQGREVQGQPRTALDKGRDIDA